MIDLLPPGLLGRSPVSPTDFFVQAAIAEATQRLTPKYYEPLRLIEFVEVFWPVLEPSRPFVRNWHIDAICEHLEAITYGDIHKLVINVPPGSSKSMLTSVFWPAWEWAEVQASLRYLFTSYAEALALRDSVKCRRLIRSRAFQDRYGGRFTIIPGQDTKKRFDNSETGFRLASSVGGLGTGERGDRICCDDPHKVSEAESDTVREAAVEWWALEMSTRNNDSNSAWLVIMQRVHDNDVAGHSLKNLGYESLVIPMEYEGHVQISTILEWDDPRSQVGELMFPARFDRKWCDDILVTLRPYGYASQMQQRPVPKEGGIIEEKWFKHVTSLPPADEVLSVIISADTANKDNNLNAYNAFGVFILTQTKIILAEVSRKHMKQPELLRTCKNLAAKWQPSVILIEDKGSGTGLADYMEEETRWPIERMMPKFPKPVRLTIESAAISTGRVYLFEGQDWEHDFLKEVCVAPFGTYWDQCDMLSQALKYIRTKSERTGADLL